MTEKRKPIVWVDGGCLGNHDIRALRNAYGSYAVEDFLPRLGVPFLKKSKRIRFSEAETNNQAEYLALIAALKDYEIGRGAEFRTDSALVVGQVTQGWKCNSEGLRYLRDTAKRLLIAKEGTLVKVPRAEIEEKLGH